MRIVLDLQGTQSESRFRGIGRYTMAFSMALAKNSGNNEIWLALNGLFPETVEAIKADFDGLIPKEHIIVFEVPCPIKEIDSTNYWRARAAERLREAFLSRLKPDIVHISSLFEGLGNNVVSSIGVLEKYCINSVTLYDLIPFFNQQMYLNTKERKNWYFRKIAYLKKGDLLLAISEYSAKEAADFLSIPQEKVINVYAGTDDCFRPLEISDDIERKVRLGLGINKNKFIFYFGGIDTHKNLNSLIEAFSLLDSNIKNDYQLVIAGKISREYKESLLYTATKNRLSASQIVFTGYIDNDDIVILCNLCALFVFPSLYEGFGLPPLEAMACGAPVIASDTSSIPEVIGFKDALFDPKNPASIAGKINEVITNESFRKTLKEHGLRQAKKFSWDLSAKIALDAFEEACKNKKSKNVRNFINLKNLNILQYSSRPRLAFVSPLPPEKTGIAAYSAELLSELSRYYDIDVIVNQKDVSGDFIKANFPVRNTGWFECNARIFDRILYQMGNSPFHAHMFALIKKYPGVVVLHDFYLSNLQKWIGMNAKDSDPYYFLRNLYFSHGYGSLLTLLNDYNNSLEEAVLMYPLSYDIFKYSYGVILHSSQNIKQAEFFYGQNILKKVYKISQLIAKPTVLTLNRSESRMRLGLKDEDFIICSFGFLDQVKLNKEIIDAYVNSPLARTNNCKLIFVGENHGGDYGKEILSIIQKSGIPDNVIITGFVSDEIYRDYLNSADMAIQLREKSRGETSRAVLDCLAHGIPLIINAHGSLDEIPGNVVVKLNDKFTQKELREAIVSIWNDKTIRQNLSFKGVKYIEDYHHPYKIGKLYYQAIEYFSEYSDGAAVDKLMQNISVISEVNETDKISEPEKNKIKVAGCIKSNIDSSESDIYAVSKCIFANHSSLKRRELFIDISATARTDLKTGIERVANSITFELIKNPPDGWRVEPVYLAEKAGGWHYKYARSYMSKLIGINEIAFVEEEVEPGYGDILLGLDLFGGVIDAEKTGLFTKWRNKGVDIYFIVYDILPILIPEVFPPEANICHEGWVGAISKVSNGFICISRSVADEVLMFLNNENVKRYRDLKIGYFHLGANLDNISVSTKEILKDGYEILKQLKAYQTFLMVGTIEPRKGYLQVISAFEKLWADGKQVNLAIIGKEGWTPLPDSQRRTIPQVINKLRNHPERGNRLFWLEGISDEYLKKVYEASNCLIAASEGEGFGLPLIEAAQHKLPILARDIPVFREVADDYAFYFNGNKPEDLVEAIKDWLNLYKDGKHPKSDNIPYLTWKQSADQLMGVIFSSKWYCNYNSKNEKHYSF